MEVRRTFDLLERYKQNFVKDDVFGVKSNGEWIKFITLDYINNESTPKTKVINL